MAGLPRVPGEFSRSSMGNKKFAYPGWRRFRFTDAGVDVEDGANACVDSIVETTGNTVITFLNTHSHNSEHPIDGRVGITKLKTPEGVPLRFGDPFCLKVMIELISISGSYTGATDTSSSKPQVCLGIGMNATDADNDSNRHFVYGWRSNAESASSETIDEDSRWIFSSLATGGSGQDTTNAGSGDNCVLYIGEFVVGPDMTDGSGGAEAHNAHLIRGEFADSNHATKFDPGDSNITSSGLGANQGFNDGAAQVYLYACVSDKNVLSADDGNPCVVTCRLWYMVEADFTLGWGTS